MAAGFLRAQAAGAVKLASRRQRDALLYMLVMSLRLCLTFMASGFSRAALVHPFIVPLSFFYWDACVLRSHQQSCFMLTQVLVCEQNDTLHAIPIGTPWIETVDVGYRRNHGAPCC